MRFRLACFALLLGCHAPRDAATPREVAKSSDALPAAEIPSSDEPAKSAPPAAPGAEKVVSEAVRQLRAMKTTKYRHKPRVDEEAGIFEYDCSGFITYALQHAAPDALAMIPIGPKGRAQAEQYVSYFAGLVDSGTGPWARVPRASEIRAGDLIAWRRPDEVDSANTGHIVIALDAPKKVAATEPVREIGGAAEWLVRVVDSTQTPHANDVRGPDTTTGLGTGTIGVVVDGDDVAIGYRWKGGQSPKAFATVVAIARVR